MKLAKIIFISILVILFFGCSKSPSPAPKSGKPLILVSIAPYRFLAEQVAGSDFEVRTIAPSSANPHAFEPTSTQVAGLVGAQVWFQIGEAFEGKIQSVLKGHSPKMVVQDLRTGVDMLEEHHACSHCSKDHYDRHIWLSPKLAVTQAESITRVLSEQFPEKQPIFEANLAELRERLIELDAEIHTLLEPVKERVILVSHPAFGYFCREYAIEQLSVEQEGKEPRPKYIEEILKRASHAEIALALPQYNNKGAQMIAEKLSVPIHLIDPYSADYFETMRKLAHLIAATNHDN